MESFISFDSDNGEDEERLYCSAPQAPEDIIWAGSDTEQSADEIERKRLRYEYHAQRCLRGQLPILLSANLKGSFNKGCVNPWRYRKRKVPDWWQPGSENMLFTKANVLKRAAEHGMGHLNPTEALAWCKAEAEAEALIKREEVDVIDLDEYSDAELVMEEDRKTNDQEVLQRDHDGRTQGRSNTPQAHAHPERPSISAAARNNIEQLSRELDIERRSTKRAADSLWLKGSYVSKRAKWNSPAESSPTPLPNVHSEKEQRQRLGSTRSSIPRESNPTTPRAAEAQNRELLLSSGNSGSEDSHPPASRTQINPPFRKSRLSNLTPILIENESAFRDREEGPRETSVSAINYEEEMDLQDNQPSPHIFTFSSLKLINDSIPVMNPPTTQHHMQSVGFHSGKLSTVPHSKTPRTRSSVEEVDEVDEISFITEIAPSSRDLEHFKYRKKRQSSRQESSGPSEKIEPHEITRRSSAKVQIPEAGEMSNEQDSLNVSQDSRDFQEDLERVPLRSPITSDIVNLYLDSSPDPITSSHKQLSSPNPPIRNLSSRSPIADVDDEETQDDGEFEAEDEIIIVHESSDSWDTMDNANLISPLSKADISIHPVAGVDISPPPENAALDVDLPRIDELPQGRQDSIKLPIKSPPISFPQVTTTLTKLKEAPSLASSQSSHRRDPANENTLSYNPTPMASLRSPFARSTASSRLSPLPAPETQASLQLNNSPFIALQLIAGEELPHTVRAGLRQNTFHTPKDDDVIDALAHNASFQQNFDPMQIIQHNLSQDHQSTPGGSDQNAPRSSYNFSHTPLNEEDVDATNYVIVDATSRELSQLEEEESQLAPQSPWATVNIDGILPPDPVITYGNEHNEKSELEKEREDSPEQNGSVEDMGWQPLEPDSLLESEGIKPFRDFMTPTRSPERPEPRISEAGLPSTQLLLEATMGNPWTSAFKNPASGKSKKRVSFGSLQSEEHTASQALTCSPSKSMPSTVKHIHEDYNFKDGTTAVNKFGNHLQAIGGIKNKFAKRRHDSLLHFSSPAVGAMAEAFIAADRDTSLERDRPQAPPETPSRHLKPVTVAKTNIDTSPAMSFTRHRTMDDGAAPSGPIDYDVDDSLDDFLGDVEGVLEEWSVETELKKVVAPESGKKSGNSDERRGLFSSFSSGW
jgi:hypothetical protein